MAEVTLHIGGYAYGLSCADGEEDALRRAGEMVAARVTSARAMLGGLTETRQLLFAAILLADELHSGGGRASDGTSPADLPDAARAIDEAGMRIERIAQALDALLARPVPVVPPPAP